MRCLHLESDSDHIAFSDCVENGYMRIGKSAAQIAKEHLELFRPANFGISASEAETHPIGCMQFVNCRLTTFIPDFLEPAAYQRYVCIVFHGRTLYHRRN